MNHGMVEAIVVKLTREPHIAVVLKPGASKQTRKENTSGIFMFVGTGRCWRQMSTVEDDQAITATLQDHIQPGRFVERVMGSESYRFMGSESQRVTE